MKHLNNTFSVSSETTFKERFFDFHTGVKNIQKHNHGAKGQVGVANIKTQRDANYYTEQKEETLKETN